VRYRDFDLWIDEPAEGVYPLRAICAEQGEARDRAAFDVSAADLRVAADRLERGETDAAFLQQVGGRLWCVLFESETRDVGALFERARGASGGNGGGGLRVRLRIEDAPLGHLPWELLYSTRDDTFLATDAATALVRYVELPRPIRAVETDLPVRVLVVMPEAEGLDVAGERRILEEAMAGLYEAGRLEVTWLDGRVPLSRISDALLEQPHHVLHFVGHGGFENEQAYLLLDEPGGGAAPAGHEAFASLFRNHPAMKLVVLNSCQGAETSAHRPLVGLAPALVKCGVPAVVAMKYPIYDQQAVVFAREFYRCLFRGQERGRVEVAISHARNRLAASFPGDRVLATPVLYTRAPEGLLFNLLERRPLGNLPLSRRALETSEAAIRTHEANLSLLAEGREREEEQGELDRLRHRVRLRNAALAAVLAVGLGLSLLASLQVFDRLPPEWKVESYTVWLGNALRAPALSDAVALVTTSEQLSRDWRGRHARLLDRLAEAGARVVAFDEWMRSEQPDDAALADAIRRARGKGTDVVLVAGDFDERTPSISPRLREAATSWGVACLGRKALGTTAIVPLVTTRPAWTGAPDLPAFSLAAVLAHGGETLTRLVEAGPPAAGTEAARPAVLDRTGRVRPLPLSDRETLRWESAGCRALQAGDEVGTRVIDHAPAAALHARTLRYEDVERGAFDPARVRGRIVVVGSERERFGVLRGLSRETRSGMELHADAMNTLLTGVTLRPLAPAWQLVITLLMAAVGAAAPYLGWEGRRRRLFLLGALAVYLTANVWLYVRRQVMLNTLFQVGALFAASALVGRLSRRWGMNKTQRLTPSRAAALALLLALPLAGGCATAGFARLDGVTRDGRIATLDEAQAVTVLRGGETARTEPGMALLKGDRITTGPGTQAVLTFEAGWEVILEPETELEILNPSIFIRFGRAIATALGRVREVLKAQTEFVVAAPETTQYVIDARGDTFSVTVLEGHVRVESKTQAWPPTVYGPSQRGTVVGPARPQRMPALDTREVAAVRSRVSAVRQMVAPRVPRLTGLRREKAEDALRSAGLGPAEVQVRVTGRAPEGTVLAQAPQAGAPARLGERVRLIVEGRPRTTPTRDPDERPRCTVPEVRGMTVAQAAQALKGAGLALGDHPRDTKLRVRWQSASARTALPCGARVNVGSEVVQ
jgi:CHASE2 domain-containing sensor protein